MANVRAILNRWFNGLLILLSAWCCIGAEALHTDLGDGAYRLPLVGDYAVYRDDGTFGSRYEKGTYRLVEEMRLSSGVSFGGADVVPKVQQIAVFQKIIVGRAAQGFFLFDTGNPYPKPEFFEGDDKWHAALKDAGIAGVVQLSKPDALAALLPDTTLHPLDYRAMHGLFGLSDDWWSLMVQMCGLMIVLVIGLRSPPKRSPMVAAIVLGIVVNVVAQILISGGGPAAFLGFLMYPLLFYVAAVIGKGVRWLAGFNRKTVPS